MPTIISHAAVPLAIGIGLGRGRIPSRLLLAGVAAAIAPDLDVVAFKLGIAYADTFGHRGASHSLMFALLLAAGASAAAPLLRTSGRTSFFFILAAAVSHPLLDMLTNGGLGVALFWPVSDLRYFAPWQVIEVSPLSLRRVFSAQGLAVMRSELAWVWAPCAVAASIAMRFRRANASAAHEICA